MRDRTGDANDHKAKGGGFSVEDTEPMELPPEGGQADEEEGEVAELPVSDLLADRWKWLGDRGGWLGTEPPRRTYLLASPGGGGHGLLPLGKAGMIAAGGGMGKSWAVTQLALAVATGRPWLGTYPVTSPGHVLLALAEEEAEEVQRRLFYVAQDMKLDEEERRQAEERILPLPLCGEHVALTYSPEELDAMGVAGIDPSSPEAIETPLARELRDRLEGSGVKWRLVILDPLSRFAGPDVEKDNAAATRFVQLAERLTRVPGNPTVLLSHHMNKAGRASEVTTAGAARGASALTDGFRWQANLEVILERGKKKNEPRRELPDFTRLVVSKNNYGPRPEPLYLERGEHGVLTPVTERKVVDRLRALAESQEEDEEAATPPKRGGAAIVGGDHL